MSAVYYLHFYFMKNQWRFDELLLLVQVVPLVFHHNELCTFVFHFLSYGAVINMLVRD